MAVNKVIYSGEVLIDLTMLTVTPETLAEGVVAINAKGELIVGTAKFNGGGSTSAKLGEAVLGTMELWGLKNDL